MDFSVSSLLVTIQKFASHNQPPASKEIDAIVQSYMAQLEKNYTKKATEIQHTNEARLKYNQIQSKNIEYLQKEEELRMTLDTMQKHEQSLYKRKAKSDDTLRELKALLQDKKKEIKGQSSTIEQERLLFKTVFGLEMIVEENDYFRIVFTKFTNSITKAYFRFRIEEGVLYAVEINPSLSKLPSITSDINDMIQGMTISPLLDQIRSILKNDPSRLVEILKRLHMGWSQL